MTIPSLGIPEDCCRMETATKIAYFISDMQELLRTRADLIEELQRQHLHQGLLQHPHRLYPHQKPHLLDHHMLQDPCHANLLHSIIHLQPLHIWTDLGLLQLSKMIVQLKLQLVLHIDIPGQPIVWLQQGLPLFFSYQ